MTFVDCAVGRPNRNILVCQPSRLGQVLKLLVN